MKNNLLSTTILNTIVLVGLFGGTAYAQSSDTGTGNGSATANLSISASVVVTCTITASDLAFGTYSSGATATGSSTVAVSCDGIPSSTPYIVLGGSGETGSGLTNSLSTARAMIGATAQDALGYDLSGTTGSDLTVGGTVSLTLTSTSASGTLYGTIPTGQKVHADTYSDTVALTLTY